MWKSRSNCFYYRKLCGINLRFYWKQSSPDPAHQSEDLRMQGRRLGHEREFVLIVLGQGDATVASSIRCAHALAGDGANPTAGGFTIRRGEDWPEPSLPERGEMKRNAVSRPVACFLGIGIGVGDGTKLRSTLGVVCVWYPRSGGMRV